MRIQEAARELGVSADWLRRLERMRRVPPASRDVNGHRRYTRKHIADLRRLLFPNPKTAAGAP